MENSHKETKGQDAYVPKPHSAGFKAAFPEGMKHASPVFIRTNNGC